MVNAWNWTGVARFAPHIIDYITPTHIIWARLIEYIWEYILIGMQFFLFWKLNNFHIFDKFLLLKIFDVFFIQDDKVNLFVALQQGETELCVNETTLGDHQSSEMLSHSISTISTLQSTTIMSESQNHDRRKIVASSPAFDVTATSSVGKETTLSLPAIKVPSRNNRCQVSALVAVDVLWKQNVSLYFGCFWAKCLKFISNIHCGLSCQARL